MRVSSFCLAVCMLPLLGAQAYAASTEHAAALYGGVKYPKGFTHTEYVNPDAPKGGVMKLAETGTFDSVNPFILKGVKAPGLGYLFLSLMTQSLDEPMSMYGVIATDITVADDHLSAAFTLRDTAKWHDGTPITADDVVFSFNTLKSKGDPTYKILYAPIASVKKTGKNVVTFYFADAGNKELPFVAGQMPIISKAYYSTHAFDTSTLDTPMGSGPYTIGEMEQGRFISYQRVKDHWTEDLPIMRGMYNFDTVRYDMYRDENVNLEGLKAGQYDFRREYISRNWATAYDIAAVKDGRIIKREIPDGNPQGMQAFIFNSRKAKFSDPRVREAIDLSMDFEWINKTIFYGAYKRNYSFFANTDFEARGVPEGDELALLAPFKDSLPSGLFTSPYTQSKSNGSGNNRANLRKATQLLDAAGWTIAKGVRVNAQGEPLTIEFLLRQPTMERVIGPMRKNLERLGIKASIRMVDDSQYQKRLDDKDFDIVSVWVNRGVFFPGSEQMAIWHSSQADVKGANNLAGTKDPVIDALLEKLSQAKNKDALIAAGRALDRVLLWRHYVIPHWHSGSFRIAYWDRFGLPKMLPKYNLGLDTWWSKNP